MSLSNTILETSQPGLALNYSEFRRHLGKTGITINDFAAYLCVRPSSVSNYAKAGKVPRTYAMLAVLMGEAVDRGVPVADVLARYGIVQQPTEKGNVRQFDMFRVNKSAS